MAFEDFLADYTEGGAEGDVTIAQYKISWNDLDRDEYEYVYKDKGAAHFSGDFEHLFEIQFSDRANSPAIGFHGVSSAAKDMKALVVDDEDAQLVEHYSAQIKVLLIENGTDDESPHYTGSDSTTYYCTFERDDDGGGTSDGLLTLEIRTGSHTGNLEDTVTIDCTAQLDHRYCLACISWRDNNSNYSADGFIENLDLQEGAPPAGFNPWFIRSNKRGGKLSKR